MAAGRHGGYRDHEFRDREADFGMSRKEIGYSKNGEYDRVRKGSRDYDRGQSQGRGSLEYRGRIRQKDIKERDTMNGGYRTTSSRSDSGSSGGAPRRCGSAARPMDREPGELSSDGSVGALDSETQFNKETEVTMLESGSQLTPVQNKKRKFSPIVWDRDDRDATRIIKSRKVLETNNLPPPPPPPTLADSPKSNSIHDDDEQISLVEDNEVHISEAPPSEIDSSPYVLELSAETASPLPHEEDRVDNLRAGANDYDDYVPRTITSSRWANDAESPADEGEISDYEDNRKLKRKSGSESAEAMIGRKSISPGLGEGSERTKGRSSGSDERVRSSSRDSYHDTDDKNDCIEVDDDQNYDVSDVSHYDSESEDDVGSHGTPEPVHPPQRSFNMLQGCRNVDEFERLNKIDEGTYGVVFRAKDKKTGEVVALKKVKMEREREGFPLTSLREINILLSFHHPSIVDVKEVVVGSNLDSIYMVMEYMEHDLKGLMETMKQPYSQSEVKCLMLQLLEGIKYLHDNWVLHRDLKTSNLLLNNRGELKICDFGLARQYGSPLKPYTPLVVTLWYRAPELLLGAKQYSTAIDMWSLGCIMAELLSKAPLFNGKSEVEQLDKIFKILGTPNETIWPGLSDLPGAKVNFVKHKYNLLRKKYPATSFTGSPVLSDAGFDLLNKLLTYDPKKRITAEAALNHEWFREVPLPKSKEFMPTFPAQHAQDRRMRRAMKSPDPLEEQMRKEKQGDLGTGGLFGQ
ncbi:Protein kinase superfamily protein [Perilla frutescens var. hirtella]|nr:Protein kinase superfamily protein [Perilla frutescens var. hirtella]KAH6807292.1 Protein kinase superfamily protein [Perilla frutescens var. frutescens]